MKERKEEKKKKKRKNKGMEFMYGTRILYGFMTFSMEVFVWILVVPFIGFS